MVDVTKNIHLKEAFIFFPLGNFVFIYFFGCTLPPRILLCYFNYLPKPPSPYHLLTIIIVNITLFSYLDKFIPIHSFFNRFLFLG